MNDLIVIFDTETTGLPLHPDAPLSKQPKIIELGAVLVNREGEVVQTYNQLIHPGEAVSWEITRITGISNEDLEGAPPFSDVLPMIRGVFEQASAVFAHNLPFDRTMLRNELARLDVLDFPWPKREYCTVGLHNGLWGRNPKLIELYEYAMGKPLPQTHRALDDALALTEIVIALELHTLAFSELDEDAKAEGKS